MMIIIKTTHWSLYRYHATPNTTPKATPTHHHHLLYITNSPFQNNTNIHNTHTVPIQDTSIANSPEEGTRPETRASALLSHGALLLMIKLYLSSLICCLAPILTTEAKRCSCTWTAAKPPSWCSANLLLYCEGWRRATHALGALSWGQRKINFKLQRDWTFII